MKTRLKFRGCRVILANSFQDFHWKEEEADNRHLVNKLHHSHYSRIYQIYQASVQEPRECFLQRGLIQLRSRVSIGIVFACIRVEVVVGAPLAWLGSIVQAGLTLREPESC